MPNSPQPGRRDGSAIEDTSLAALLEGAESLPDAAAGLQSSAEVLAALRAGPTADELAGEAAAMAEFRRHGGVSAPSRRPRRRRPFVLTSLLSAKAAAAAAVAAVTVGSAAAAAFAGALPAPMQKFAHTVLGAPAAGPKLGESRSPAGPSPTGPAAFGLCNAYQHALKHGTAAQRSVAFRNLAKAAGGAGQVAAFCASVRHPGASPSQHPTGRPTAHPAHPTPHPTGRPTAHPTHPAHPTPHPHPTPNPAHSHPTGKPTSAL